uniref:Uncharacterized protein n=1 Tax=Canis lupus dingo TaxID=286419 RepID=A0A8C0KJ29_CANLU
MMRLSHSGSSVCGSGCVSSMAGAAVDHAADTDTSLRPASGARPSARAAHAPPRGSAPGPRPPAPAPPLRPRPRPRPRLRPAPAHLSPPQSRCPRGACGREGAGRAGMGCAGGVADWTQPPGSDQSAGDKTASGRERGSVGRGL